MISLRLTGLSIVTAAALGVIACNDDDGSTSMPSEGGHEGELDAVALADIERLADQAVAAGIPGVSLAIIRGDQTITMARGVADRATGAPMSVDAHVRMASLAKSFTASIVLQLVAEGRLTLSDTLAQRLPGTLPASGEVTIERLLRQESGLFDFSSDERYLANLTQGDFGHAYTTDELVNYAAAHPPVFAPGAQFMYSNTNYLVLALIAERITGKPMAELVDERIAAPLGLTESSFVTSTDLPEPFAHGYMVGLGDPIDITATNGSSVYGCGNLVSTPLEMAKFYGALVAGKAVAAQQLPLMFARTPDIETSYGMGVFHFDHSPNFASCGEFVGHDGGIPGYDSVAYSSVDGKRQFAIVATSFTVDEKVGDEAARKAFGELVNAIACR